MNRNGEGDGRDHGWLECDVSVLITASSFLTLVCASVGVAVAGRRARRARQRLTGSAAITLVVPQEVDGSYREQLHQSWHTRSTRWSAGRNSSRVAELGTCDHKAG
jgi:hypothetical protein